MWDHEIRSATIDIRWPPGSAAYDAQRYKRFAEFLKDQGLIPEALPAEAYGVELR